MRVNSRKTVKTIEEALDAHYQKIDSAPAKKFRLELEEYGKAYISPKKRHAWTS